MTSANDLIPASIFLASYFGIFLFLSFLFFTKRIKWASRYTFIYIHVILRVGGQTTGVLFACLSWDEPQTSIRINTLIAFLVLSAEGYFSLVICAYRFLIVWEQEYFEKSILEPLIPKGTPFLQRLKMANSSLISYIDWALVGANAIIITGSSMMAGSFTGGNRVATGKNLRLAGTAIFLVIVQLFIFFCRRAYKIYTTPGFQGFTQDGHKSIWLIIATWPFLTIRGIFGIISLVLPKFSYYNMDNYIGSGLAPSFLAGEYLMATLPEFLSCVLLTCTYFWRKQEVEHIELHQESSAEEESYRKKVTSHQ